MQDKGNGILTPEQKTRDHKKKIARTSVAIVLAAVSVYISYLSYFDIGALFAFVENETLRTFVLATVQWLVLEGSFSIIYFCFNYAYRFCWKRKYRAYYLKGTWLHIHEKTDTKIGVVQVDQDFFEVKFSATNMRPGKQVADSVVTKWYYLATEFEPNSSAHDKFVGCYLANRSGDRNKYGVHIFTKIECDRYPTKLVGSFGDTLRPEDPGIKNINAQDRTGRVYLFKMPRCIKEYISFKNIDSFDRGKLGEILDQGKDFQPKKTLWERIFKIEPEKIGDTEFYKELEKVLAINDCRARYRRVAAYAENRPNGIVDKATLDKYIAKLLCAAVFCDKKIAIQELDTVDYVLGTNWDVTFVEETFKDLVVQKNGVPTVADITKQLKNADGDLWFYVGELILNTMKCIILADGETHIKEAECEEKIKAFFDYDFSSALDPNNITQP